MTMLPPANSKLHAKETAKKKVKFFRFKRQVIRLTAFCFLVWFGGMTGFIYSTATLKPQNTDKKTDAIVILTGGRNRINSGLEILSKNGSANIFISGVNENVSIDEIRKMYRGEKRLPECCISLGYRARNTMNNAIESREWLEDMHFSSIRLVTSDYHMPRALIEFRHAMPELEIIRHPVTEDGGHSANFWYNAIKEYNKTIITYLRQAVTG